MNIVRQITDIRRLILRFRLVDQDGQEYTALPTDATLDWTSSDPAISAVQVLPGGMRAACNSGKLGTATITATPGGSISGPEFGPHTCELTIVESLATSSELVVESEEDEILVPPIE